MHCTNCGKEVPSDAEFCSGCGTKVAVSQAEPETTTKKQPSRKMAGCLVLLCIMGFLAWLVSDSSESTDPAPTEGITEPKPVGDTTTDGTRQINGTNRFGCSDRELYEKLGSYAAQKDMAAFRQVLAAGLVSEACTKFAAGEEVFIADTAIFSGLVKVRRKGEMAEYWTNLEATKQ